ncbi:MAG: hypothetical protein ACQ9MH_05255 [Nitrospinales bacterium]
MMFFRFLIVLGILLFSVGSVQASHKDRDYNRGQDNRYDRYDNDDDGYKRNNNYRRGNEYRWWRRQHQGHNHYKGHKKAAKQHRKEHKRLIKARRNYFKQYRKHRHYNQLPAWAHHCGLPPGIAKRHKIPRRWERRCRAGQKYYDYRDEFRNDIYADQRVVYRDQPSYQTIYEMDASECKAQAIHTSGNVAERVAIGAVFGGIIGAAGGAIIGSTTRRGAGRGATTGAIGGALGGAVLGGILASNDYQHDYNRCMSERGHWRY